MNLKNNFTVKCIAVVLFAVFLTTTLLSCVCLVCGVAMGTFTTEAEQKEYKEEFLQSMLWYPASMIRDSLRDYSHIEDLPFDYYNIYQSENVLYEIYDAEGKVFYSNLDGTEGDIFIYDEYIFAVLKEEYKDSDLVYEETLPTDYGEEGATAVHTNSREEFYVEKSYSFNVYLKEEMTAKDSFYWATEFFDYVAEHKTSLIITAIISPVLALALFIFLMCAAGHKAGVEGIHVSRFDRFPVDVLTATYLGLTALLGVGVYYLIEAFSYDMTRYYDATMAVIVPFLAGLCIIGIVLDFVLLAIQSITTAVRLKTRTYIKSTLIFIVLNFLFNFLKWNWKTICKICRKSMTFTGGFLRKIPLVWKTILIVIVLGFLEIPIYVISHDCDFPLWFIFNIVLGVFAIFVAIILKQIKKGTEEIAKGNIYKKINTKYMFLDFKDHAENINNINDGIAKAVEERMKSERFKTELITNVSHDIKTPLTSIINYVDLLEKEEINNETAKEYIGVLSRQSARLKKLIEDLLEASKASTGNVSVNLSQFELGILLTQALGEYEERFAQNNLQVVLNKTDEMLLVMADNRHMWRVFDNILNNIAKYAQPNTRVYIDANRKNNIAEISFRNISKDALNISGDELMERFVRGDSSRNTEGSGLGLSIAKSLTEVQKGKLDIQIDGDLFKVRLAFPLSE